MLVGSVLYILPSPTRRKMLIEVLIASWIGVQKVPTHKVETIVSVESEEPPSRGIKDIAQELVEDEFGQGQWESFDNIVKSESGWRPDAQNPHSTAFGLCQFLNSTWKHGKTNDPVEQLRECVAYTSDRYNTPNEAWAFWRANRWW